MSRRKTDPAVSELAEATVTLPVGELPADGYEAEQVRGERRMHLNVFLRARAAAGLLRLRNGLRAANYKLDDGRPVFSAAEALNYVLEAFAD